MTDSVYWESPVPVAIIERYIDEYVFDFDAVKACQRLGYSPEVAQQQAVLIMRDPGTQTRLREAMEDQRLDSRLPNRVISMLMREANDYGEGSTGAARVSALRQLSNILGMDDLPQKQKEIEADVVDGSVMVLPQIADVSNWEETAVAAQENLRDGKTYDGREG